MEKSINRNYKWIFFDLDHTLWDYESNSRETLHELYHEFNISAFTPSFEKFHEVFHRINHSLWTDYHENRITHQDIRNRRFNEVFEVFETFSPSLAKTLNDEYIHKGPLKSKLFAGAYDLLHYLKSKYGLLILSNGFTDTQEIKLKESGIRHFFNWVITSESSGYTKPAQEIFVHALSVTNSNPNDVIMIGDNLETDIKGAINSGIDYIHFDPKGLYGGTSGKHKVNQLEQIQDLL